MEEKTKKEKIVPEKRKGGGEKKQGKKEKIALFHPWIKSRGGAERVVLDFLKNTKHNVDVYTWNYDKDNTFEEFGKYNVRTIVPEKTKKISRSYILRGLFFPLSLFSKIPLKEYDKFLISTGGLAELVTLKNYKPGQTYAYVHTILRASYKEDVEWNLKHRYKSKLNKMVYLSAAKFYRIFEKMAWKRINYPIFNSELSEKRAKNQNLLKNKKTEVVYPSVNVSDFEKLKGKKGKHLLYVARFGMAKRQLELVKAWQEYVKENPKTKEKLVLVGNKENEGYFEKIKQEANKTKNIEIKINLPQKELFRLYEESKAVLFVPFMEDFGIVPFEAMACGKPLIVVDKGGYVDLVKKHYNNHTIWVKDSKEKNELIKNITKGLQEFTNNQSKIKGKKTKIKGLDAKSFTNKIERILG
jgi:glycosyltransferase involved in cell wall biosynthesis